MMIATQRKKLVPDFKGLSFGPIETPEGPAPTKPAVPPTPKPIREPAPLVPPDPNKQPCRQPGIGPNSPDIETCQLI